MLDMVEAVQMGQGKITFLTFGFILNALLIYVLVLTSCRKSSVSTQPFIYIPEESSSHQYVVINNNVYLYDYLDYIDTLSNQLSSLLGYLIDEYSLVHRNPWLLDNLLASDYYNLMEQDIFIQDPGSIRILSSMDTILIPTVSFVDSVKQIQDQTTIDINIPEFKLRIKVGEVVTHTFPVRVGQNTSKYLAMAQNTIDLRTKTGNGHIVRINRNPSYINPKNNHVYKSTRRDDGKVTGLPRIPWLEPEINGQRYGQLIHPTTNPITLGKPYSNGCIGVKEADMWVIYYHAPLNTKILIRYDLEVLNEDGQTIILPDIYPGYKKEKLVQLRDRQECNCVL